MFGFATLLAAGAIGGAALMAGINQQTAEPTGRTIVVAQDGSGDVLTITEGVALALDGDTVLVRPGVYEESVVITADITLAGEGPREEAILETPADGPQSSDNRINGGYALQLDETAATVRGLTLRGEHSRLVINGGAPTVEDLYLKDVDLAFPGDSSFVSAIHINAGSQAVIRDSLLEGGGEIAIWDDSSPIIEDNVLRDGPHIWAWFDTGGSTPVIRGNVIEGFHVRGIGMFIRSKAALIEGNTIRGTGDGIAFGTGADDQASVVRGNIIEVDGTGILMEEPAPTISENDISGAATAISFVQTSVSVVPGATATLTGNTIHSNGTGILIVKGTPTIQGNALDDNAVALAFASSVAANVNGNTLCGNTVDQQVDGEPTPLDPGNTRCASDGSPAP